MLSIRKLVWDAWNVTHIARHHVRPDEVEAVCQGDPITLRGQQKNRLLLIGPTQEKRMLGIVLESQGRGRYYPVTAYDANAQDTSLYYRLRGGENDEK